MLAHLLLVSRSHCTTKMPLVLVSRSHCTTKMPLADRASIPCIPYFQHQGLKCVADYCLDLLCPLTCWTVRRMRRLMVACSFRASLSVSATTFSVAPMRRAVSASSSHRAWSSSLGWLRLPRSHAGMVECLSLCGSGAGFMKSIMAN